MFDQDALTKKLAAKCMANLILDGQFNRRPTLVWVSGDNAPNGYVIVDVTLDGEDCRVMYHLMPR